ncbi:outer membrane beta-barrel protein [Pontibacter qinzhouensis]|uniref:Outer membrane beta-barrel protein n=1 Tax=Pontibacter qinzhouensis TaxID=2603253 RepID=A0A5C8J516_9BACT|nr:outer membrane beta-barrel protein [Pontibacter qinzhouensis]TXK31172.1 outer membrane beta-barrel protein [Pontibacter qinzhouensis]
MAATSFAERFSGLVPIQLKGLLLSILLLIIALNAAAQGVVVQGTVQSGQDSLSLPGASVLLYKVTESGTAPTPTATATDIDGNFRFEQVAAGAYTLKINYIGFKLFSRAVKVAQQPVNLGPLKLLEESTTMREVEVIGRVALGEQMGDTTQFNAAAFKTNPNASAEDLVQKMPGISIEDGKIQAQGEDVMEILVDGKRFFEGDVEAALRNLPAEIIQNIQIFDKKSDQAEFSGFDDGNRAKTINIVTKPDRRKGSFGQASAGIGTDNRHMLGTSVNFFDNDRRITVTGVRNNINMADYSIGETPGGGMRGRSGDANGLITTSRLGVNFSDEWADKVELSGNYTINHREVDQAQLLRQNFMIASDSGRVYTENSNSQNEQLNQRFRMRMKYQMDENNEILFKPRFTLNKGNATSYFLGNTFNNQGPINQTENNVNSESNSLNLESDIHYRHRFKKQGRTFGTSLNNQYNSSRGDNYRIADNIFYAGEQQRTEQLNQFRDNRGTGYSWEASFSFTEPVGDSARMQLEYQVSNRSDDSERLTYNLAEITGDYTLLDTLFSNSFRSDYLTQEVELGYQYNTKKLRFQVETEYQRADLQNDQRFPEPYNMERTFHSVLPSAELDYRFSKTKNIRIDYRTNTSAPALSQLQNVIDQSNPLHLRMGNPNLRQSYQNRISMRYSNFDEQTNKVFYMGVRGSVTNNIITNSTTVAEAPIRLSEDVVLEQGSQLTRPVNLQEANWDLRTYFNYGFPVNIISSKLSFNGAVGHTRRPGMVNENINISNATNFRLGVSVSSNISEEIDFNISTRSNYNLVLNTLLPDRNNNYFNQSTSARLNWIFLKGFVYRTELNHQANAGLAAGYDNNFTLWNMSISKKLFDREQGEISLSVNDALNQNNNIRRNVTELYVEDVQANILQRYFMLTFTYSLRHFAGR